MEDKRVALTALDEGSWEILGDLANCEGACFLDLRGLTKVTPGGVVALLLMTRSRRRRFTILSLPEKRSRAFVHLKRIDLVHLVRLWGFARFERNADYDRSPPVTGGGTFTKTLISASSEHDSVFELMTRYISTTYPSQASRLKMIFTELLNNITDHASGGAEKPFYCIQMEALPMGLQLSFGDLGVGYRASLASNPTLDPFETEAEALHGAIVLELSRMSHVNPERGGGLCRALKAVEELGGRYRVLSYNGTATADTSDPLSFATIAGSFPGTLTWIDLPRITR